MNTNIMKFANSDKNKKSEESKKPEQQNNEQKGQQPKPQPKKKSSASKWLWFALIFFLVIMLFSILFSTNYIDLSPYISYNAITDSGFSIQTVDPDYDVTTAINNIIDGSDSIDFYWTLTGADDLVYITFTGGQIDGSGNAVYQIILPYTGSNAGNYLFFNDFQTWVNTGLSSWEGGVDTNWILSTNSTSFFWSLFWGLLPWVLILGGTYWIMTRVMRSQGSIGNMGKGAMTPQTSNIRFKDVAGYDEVKAELWEIVDFLKNPAKYNEAGARTPKGVLLSGPPGTGKTFFAKAVAGEASIPFYSISGSDFVEMFVGVGAKRVRELFQQAKQVAPALIFIDELDAVGRQRGAGMGGGNDEREQTLNQMLVEMDGFAANSGIVVMAATNRPDVLDPALKRPGRFDRAIEFRMPDVQEREAILKIYAKQGNKNFASDVEWANIAGRTPGFSAAQLENVINEAAILSIRLKKTNITLDIIDEAIDRVIGGPSKSNNLMSKEEKNLIAYHEAGHALVGLALEDAEQVQKITIIPRGQAGGYVLMTPKKEKFVQTKSELKAKLTSYMAGRASEEIYFGKTQVTTGAYSDIESATMIARRMVTEFGMSDLGPIQYEKPQGNVFLGRDYANASRNYSGQLAHEIDQQVRKLIDEAYKQALQLIKANRNIMDILAESLLIKETLTAEEAEFIYKNKDLPKQVKELKVRQTSLKNKKATVKKPNVTKKPSTNAKSTTKKPTVTKSNEKSTAKIKVEDKALNKTKSDDDKKESNKK